MDVQNKMIILLFLIRKNQYIEFGVVVVANDESNPPGQFLDLL